MKKRGVAKGRKKEESNTVIKRRENRRRKGQVGRGRGIRHIFVKFLGWPQPA